MTTINRSRTFAWTMAVGLAVAGTAAVACGPSGDGLLGDDGLGGGNGGSGGGNGGWGSGGGGGGTYGTDGGASTALAEKLYRAVEPQLKMKCGTTCHEAGTNAKDLKWLAGPDSYVTIKKYAGIVVDDPDSSKLMMHPGNHPTASLVGPGTPPDANLKDAVYKWLQVEATNLQGTPLPSTDPVDPIAGSVDLTKVGIAGGKITWTAQNMGAFMRFTNVQVVAPVSGGVHVVSPLFVMVPTMGTSMVDTTFSTTDMTVAAGQTSAIAPVYYFYNWQNGSKLRIEFQKIESATGGGGMDGGAQSGCKDVATFQSSAVPQLQQCLGCHAGNNAQATNALDLKALSGQVNYATACGQARFKINFNNKAASPVITTPRDKLNNHPFQVPGGNAQAYTNGLTTWINKE
jgi:hypothetical protein